jgi:hypothetical protein
MPTRVAWRGAQEKSDVFFQTLIDICSHKGSIVADLTSSTGTSLRASQAFGWHFFGIEADSSIYNALLKPILKPQEQPVSQAPPSRQQRTKITNGNDWTAWQFSRADPLVATSTWMYPGTDLAMVLTESRSSTSSGVRWIRGSSFCDYLVLKWVLFLHFQISLVSGCKLSLPFLTLSMLSITPDFDYHSSNVWI